MTESDLLCRFRGVRSRRGRQLMNANTEIVATVSTHDFSSPADDALFRKVTLRFIPLLFICYVLNYMDRTNIGFAQLQMKSDLGLSNVAYGVGASMFFVSYSLFALPSSLIMTKIGARKVIFVCLFGWGLTSAATMFIRTPIQFYALRFLLGVVEAGFFPGIIYYFSSWYPSHRRGSVIGIFTSATVVAGIVSGILSGAILMYTDHYWGLRGWQWMFLIEGLPSAFLGIGVYFYLDEKPNDAKWLSPSEKFALSEALKSDPISGVTSGSLPKALLNWRVYVLGLIYFLAVFGTFVLAFWQPTMIKEFGVSNVMAIGFYSAIPPIGAVIAKIFVGSHSDAKKELRWHFAAPAFAGALGFTLTTFFSHSPLLGIACLTLATAGVHGCMPMIWAAPGLYWSDSAAAAAIAVISTIGTVSGAVGPAMLGAIRTVTGSFTDGMYLLSAILALAAGLMLVVVKKEDENPRAHGKN
jgi:MFS family permease